MSHLLLLGCSKRKRGGLLPGSALRALELYDGPNFRVVRRFRTLRPSEQKGMQIFIVSARWGLISADTHLKPYDLPLRELEQAQLQRLEEQVSKTWTRILEQEKHASIFIGLSREYAQLLGGWQKLVTPSTPLYIAPGPQGHGAAALKEWLAGCTSPPDWNCRLLSKGSDVRLAGCDYKFTVGAILSCLHSYGNNLPASSRRFHSYYAHVAGKQVSPKWLVSELTGLSYNQFNTGQACRALRVWGIEVLACSVLANCRITPCSSESSLEISDLV